MLRNRKAQSMLEYVIILSALVLAIAVVGKVAFAPKVDQSLANAGSAIEGAANKLTEIAP